MKKKLKILAIISVFLALLIALFVFLKFFDQDEKMNKPNKNSEEKKISSVGVTKMESSSIKSVRIKNQVSDFKIEVKSRDDFFVEEVSDVQKDEVKTALETLSNLSAIKIVSEDSQELEIYGLSVIQNQILIERENGESKELYLGTNTPTSSGAYLKVKGDPRVYVISLSDARIFKSSPRDYKKQ